MAFDKKAFFAAGRAVETVTVPGYGAVGVRSLSGLEYEAFEAGCEKKGPDGKPVYRTDRALLVRMTAVDPDTGEPVFTDADLPDLRETVAGVLNPIAKAALRKCGVGEDAGGN